MADLGSLFRSAARKAGRTVGAVDDEFSEGRIEGALPQDEAGQVKIVCRRYAERRAVELDSGVPTCHEEGIPDCESCLEDLEDGTVETW
jgi:hypothetical protein